MTEELKAKIVEALNDKEVSDAFLATDSTEAGVAVLAGAGVEVTVEELDAYIESIGDDDELSEENLDDVAGGFTAAQIVKWGLPVLYKVLKCNKYTNWGRNGKKCICGYHAKFEELLGIK